MHGQPQERHAGSRTELPSRPEQRTDATCVQTQKEEKDKGATQKLASRRSLVEVVLLSLDYRANAALPVYAGRAALTHELMTRNAKIATRVHLLRLSDPPVAVRSSTQFSPFTLAA